MVPEMSDAPRLQLDGAIRVDTPGALSRSTTASCQRTRHKSYGEHLTLNDRRGITRMISISAIVHRSSRRGRHASRILSLKTLEIEQSTE